ncbi:DUF418 domain-containing protein [Virgibacillus pantothenticus]|uniref:DUF418 domain-containing protein n=1 Tax=Virgibacillus pantothenticus TaxID=1473 RepID=UPI0025AEF544|nr:DUF418 domain-containing protein [Virgibacillus pantothenticus]
MNKKRITVVDQLRGFSLLGILIANMLIFQYGMYGKDELEYFSVSKFDDITHHLIEIFIETSFMPIFAFLFGYGMMKMKEKLEEKHLPVKRYLARRFLLLSIIGYFHGAYLWEGDILLIYGIIGFILLLFLKRRTKTILIWAIALLFITTFLSYGGKEVDLSTEDTSAMEDYIAKSKTVYQNGSYADILAFSSEDPLFEMFTEEELAATLLITPFLLLPMFLFGMYAANRRWFINLDRYQKRWRRLAILFILSGIVLKSLSLIIDGEGMTSLCFSLGGPVLAFGYIFAFSLLFHRKSHDIVVKGFEAVGKLSLSNYLLQTIVCVSIFYGYGLGLFGKLGVLTGVGLSIVVFAIQMVLSFYYIKRFRSGPFEKIMRIWTYLSWSGKLNVKHEIQLQDKIS